MTKVSKFVLLFINQDGKLSWLSLPSQRAVDQWLLDNPDIKPLELSSTQDIFVVDHS